MSTYIGVPQRYEHFVEVDFTDPDSHLTHPAANYIDYESAQIADGELALALEALSARIAHSD